MILFEAEAIYTVSRGLANELSIKCFSSSSSTYASRPAGLISSSNLSFNFFLIARHTRFPSVDLRLKFQKRAPSRRNDRSQQVYFSSSCRRITAFLQSSPCLQRVLPRVGGTVSCLTTRKSHECCGELLQNKLQVLNSSFHIRHSRQEFQIDGSLLTPAKESLRLLQPLLKILLFVREFLRTTEAFSERLSELEL